MLTSENVKFIYLCIIMRINLITKGKIQMRKKTIKRNALFVLMFLMFIACANAKFGFKDNVFGASGTTNVILPQASTVSIVQSSKSTVGQIQYEEIKSMVREAINAAGGFNGLIHNGDVIAIKPNLVQQSDYTLPGWKGRPLAIEANGVTTDWRVTKAVVELVREINTTGKVYVMEGSANSSTDNIMTYFNYTPEYIPGVDEFIALEKDSGEWGDVNSSSLVNVNLPDGLLHTQYYLNKKYKEADVIISIPTLKNHWSAAVSGAVKNVGIGATPANIYGVSATSFSRTKMVVHDDTIGSLHKWIRDYYKCRPVDFVIMDGLQGIQNGPTPCYDKSGTSNIDQDQMNMKLILAGKDAVAVDTIESLVMGWDPESVKYLQYLNQDGLGNLDTGNINVVGKQVDCIRKMFAGIIPAAGGSKITDTIAPTLALNSQSVADNKLNLNLAVESDTKKVEVYIDGILCTPAITSEFNNISLDISGYVLGLHNIKICVYDRFLNHSELDSTFTQTTVKYEAENAQLIGMASVSDDVNASDGKKVVISSGKSVQFNNVIGGSKLTLRYKSMATVGGKISVYINDTNTANMWVNVTSTYIDSIKDISIKSGSSIRIQCDSGEYDMPINLDNITISGDMPNPTPSPTPSPSPTPTPTPTPVPIKYEAENATLGGNATPTNDTSVTPEVMRVSIYSNAHAIFTNVSAGNGLVLHYLNPNVTGNISVYVNGVDVADILCTNNTSYVDSAIANIPIPEGASIKIRADSDDTAVRLDYITILN